MNDNQKKAAVVGGGAIAVGYYVLSRKNGSDGGGMGSVLGKAGSGLSLPGSNPTADTPSNPASTISDILSSLPPTPTFMGGGGMGGGSPASAMRQIPIIGGGGSGGAVQTKKGGGGGVLGILSSIPKIEVYSVMKPTQILGGSAARAEAAAETVVFNKKQLQAHHAAQRRRVYQYPRTSHAISMLTGGATAHAPVTKKQYAARRRHPVIYHTWKSLFGWLGA